MTEVPKAESPTDPVLQNTVPVRQRPTALLDTGSGSRARRRSAARAPPGGRWRAGTAPRLAPPLPASAQHGDAQQGGAAADPGHPAGAGGARETEAGAGGEGLASGTPGGGPAPAPRLQAPARRHQAVTPRALRGSWESRGSRPGCAFRGPPVPRLPSRAEARARGAGRGAGERKKHWAGGGLGGRMAFGAGGLCMGALERRVAVSFGGWMRVGGFVVFEGSVGCRRLVQVCPWALAGWGKRRLWEGHPVIQSGLWRMEERMSFWGPGVDPLDGIFDRDMMCLCHLDGDRLGEQTQSRELGIVTCIQGLLHPGG